MKARAARLGNWWKRHPQAHLVLLSAFVGVVAGFGALLFNLVLDGSNHLFMGLGVGYQMPQPGGEGPTVMPDEPLRRWLFLIVPAVGGVLSGFLVFTFAPEAEGHGTDAMIKAFHRGGGVIRKRIPLLKTIASALTIGSGGSAGREGPIAQVGAGFGSALATWLKVSDRERRILMLAGAGAGIGAVFRAPLGGALFAVEVLYRDIEFESNALAPTFIASIASYSIYCGITDKWGAIFQVPHFVFEHPMELPLYLLLGVVCALMGILYITTLHGVRDRIFRKIAIPPHFKPALGGLAVGSLGYFLPQVLGMGYGWVQLAIDGKLALNLIIGIAIVKILATSFTIGSGGSGGVFAPSIVIGGLVGAAFGLAFHQWFPTVVTQPGAFALVGMAGFFAGAAKTPVSSLIMVSEMTTGYGLLAPLMLVTAIGYMFTPKRISLYESQVDSRLDSPAHEGEYVIDVLENIPVHEAMPKAAKPTVFRSDSRLPDILKAVAESKQHVFPVLNQDGSIEGVIYFDDIRIFFTERAALPQALIAHDLLAPGFTTIESDETLASALRKFRTANREELPVVENKNSLRVIGVLGRRDIVSSYHDRLVRFRKK